MGKPVGPLIWCCLLGAAQADVAALLQTAAIGVAREEVAVNDSDILADVMALDTFDRKSNAKAEANRTAMCAGRAALCDRPFNCHMDASEARDATGLIANADGHPNMNWYCDSKHLDAMVECAAGNLTAYALLRKEASENIYDHTMEDVMAQYCFHMGHCTDMEVPRRMNLRGAEQLCDKRFGSRKAWAGFKRGAITRTRLLSIADGTLKLQWFGKGGLVHLKLGRPSAVAMGKMACAEGHYHCDVIHCQENLCLNPKYLRRYKNLL